MNVKQKFTETVEFVKTHPKEIISFSVGVATVVTYNALKDVGKTTLVMETKKYEKTAQGLGIYEFKDTIGDTVLIAKKYLDSK